MINRAHKERRYLDRVVGCSLGRVMQLTPGGAAIRINLHVVCSCADLLGRHALLAERAAPPRLGALAQRNGCRQGSALARLRVPPAPAAGQRVGGLVVTGGGGARCSVAGGRRRNPISPGE